MLLKAVQSPSPIPLFVAQRSEDIIKREFAPPQSPATLHLDMPFHTMHMPANHRRAPPCGWGLMQLPCRDNNLENRPAIRRQSMPTLLPHAF